MVPFDQLRIQLLIQPLVRCRDYIKVRSLNVIRASLLPHPKDGIGVLKAGIVSGRLGNYPYIRHSGNFERLLHAFVKSLENRLWDAFGRKNEQCRTKTVIRQKSPWRPTNQGPGMANDERVRLSDLFHSASPPSGNANAQPTAITMSGILGITKAEQVSQTENSQPVDDHPDDGEGSRLLRLKQAYARIMREETTLTCRWWDSFLRRSPPQSHSTYTIQQCVPYGDSIVIAKSGKTSIWIGLHWLREQRRGGRPLQHIHGSFHGLGEGSLLPHLIDLMSTEGCQLAVYSPEIANATLVVAKYFTIHFDGL